MSRMKWLRPGYSAFCALIILGAAPPRAAADALQERIAALIAAERSREALPLALTLARAREDAAAWEQVLTLATWNADGEASLEALRALVKLAPEDRRRRRELTQRLLWARKTSEALPHARLLLAEPSERDPTTLEVATWVLVAEGDRDGARKAAERWAAAAPREPRAQWVIADLTHWSVRWRRARAAYDALTRITPEGAAAAAARVDERIEMLRHAHPTEARLEGVHWFDTVGVRYEALATDATAQLPIRATLFARAEVGRWTEARPGEGERALAVYRATARLRVEAADAWSPELLVGAEADGEGHLAPVAELGSRWTVAGVAYLRAAVQYDRYRVSLRSAEQDIRSLGPLASVYLEPTRWLFATAEGSVWWLSDSNLEARGVAAVGAHNPDPLQVEPRAFAQLDTYREPRKQASPYFTPKAPLTWGGDVTVRLTRSSAFSAEAAVGASVQGGVPALRASAAVRVELFRHLRLGGSAAHVGAAEYQQTRFDGFIGYQL